MKDNRVNHNVNREMKPPTSQCSTSTSQQGSSHVSEKGYVCVPIIGFCYSVCFSFPICQFSQSFDFVRI